MALTHRVLGWDFLRGLSAAAVATYHLLYWQKIAFVHTLGSFGVYLFFILSGASLAYTYGQRIDVRRFSFKAFLKVRYFRLAPLYVLLMLLVLPWKIKQLGLSQDLFWLYLSNASFLFGFYDPASHAVLVGGWSLGVEFIFYLMFPLLMLACRMPWGAWAVFALLIAVQVGWTAAVFSRSAEPAQLLVLYTQVPAFAAYFMGGCLLGIAKQKSKLPVFVRADWGVCLLLLGFGLLLAINPENWVQALTGWRGFVGAGICYAMVYVACRLDLSGRMEKISRSFGNATYGLYLIHPVIYFGCSLAIFPYLGMSQPSDWRLASQLLFGLIVLVSAFFLALVSERYFEKPIRLWTKSKSAALRSH